MSHPTKAVVHYRSAGRSIIVGHSALVYPVDHMSPLVSNTTIAHTSRVIAIRENGEFETLNSIYKPVKENRSSTKEKNNV